MDRTVSWTSGGWISVVVRVGAIALALAISSTGARGQLVTQADKIPRTGNPPVVFLNGYQNDCAGSRFSSTFDTADSLLQADGRVSLFFDNCAFPNHPPIESLGNEFGKFLRSLRYENGEPILVVDVVAHSMGGLIVRSYLAGKQTEEGVFTPPAETLVRKIVFLGTPHFGSPATSLLAGAGGSGDAQTAELQPGSRFLFDLATWNQGTDDLRGADAIAVLGNAANGLLLMRSGAGDGVTTLTSGSLGFFGPGRTRIVPHCHTGGLAAFVCNSRSRRLAQLDSPEHETTRILLSFLNDTPDWRSIGTAPEADPFLSKNGGLLARYRDANDRSQTIERVIAPQIDFTVVDRSLLYVDLVPSDQPAAVTLTLPNNVSAALSIPLVTGSTRAVTVKTGPLVNAIFPSASALFPRSVAPGSLISLYGNQLSAMSGNTEVTINGQAVPVSFADARQINTLAPETATGLVKVHVKNTAGEHTVNLLVEPVAPAIFPPALNAITGVLVSPQAPLRRADYVALYLTGLGATETRGGLQWAIVQPEAWIGGQPCAVTYAGRAPGFLGLDQINCRISQDAQLSDSAPVVVQSRNRVSNVTTLPLR